MKRIWAQCLKELAQFRRDRLTLALAFFLPMVALLLYGYATRLEAKDIPIAVQNFDSSSLSRDYLDTLFNNGQLKLVPWAPGDAMKQLDLGHAKATVVIPPEFSRKIRQNISSDVQVLVDGTDVNNARVVKNSILATTQYFVRSHHLNPQGDKSLLNTEVRLWFNPGRKEALYVAPGAVAINLWIFPCLLAALAMAREREYGTMLQLFTSSITSFQLVAGKALAYWIVGMMQAGMMLALAVCLFGIRLVGDVPVYLFSLSLFVACAVLFGLLMGARAQTQSAAVQMVATAGFTTALLLSGFIYPVRNINFPLSLISYVVPARYFVEASRNAFVRGSDALSQIQIPLYLFLCAVAFYLITSRVLRKMQLES